MIKTPLSDQEAGFSPFPATFFLFPFHPFFCGFFFSWTSLLVATL